MATITATLNNNAEKYRKDLLLIPFLTLREHVLQHMNFRSNVQWKEVIGLIFTGAQLRPYDGNVNVQAGLNSEARELEVQVGDVIVDENPEDLRKSILSNWALDSRNPAKHPLEAQMLALLMANIGKMLVPAVWNGVRNGSGTTTKDLFNGFDTIIAAEFVANNISAGNGNLYTESTAITASNALDYLKDVYKRAPKTMRQTMTKMFVDYELYDMAMQQQATDYGDLQYNKEYNSLYLMGSNNMCQLVPQVGKESSDTVVLTIRDNLNVGTDISSDEPTIKVKEIDNPWKTRFVTKMAVGAQISSLRKEYLFVSDYNFGT